MAEWIRCPVCGNKTRNRIKEDTELKNFPLYCPKCKHESLIEVKDLQVTVIGRKSYGITGEKRKSTRRTQFYIENFDCNFQFIFCA